MTDAAQWRQIAIRNNIDWYIAQARSWQLPYQEDADNWWSLSPVPPFYSNLVAAGRQPDQLIARIDEALTQMQTQARWSIKDAHCAYELGNAGFEVLFDAQWIARPPKRAIGPLNFDDTHVRRVQNPGEFQRWVDAWGETPPQTTVFVPRLLSDPSVCLLYVEREGVVRGGLALNQSNSAVGISNWFGTQKDVHACLSYTANNHPDLGLVGYEQSPDEVLGYTALGFMPVGELRIWIKASA